MRKLTCLLLALLMVMSLATVAFADDVDDEENTGNLAEAKDTTLVITQADGTALQGHTFAAYKLLHASVSGTNYAYKINDKYLSVLQSVSGKTTETDIMTYLQSLTTGTLMADAAKKLYDEITKAGLSADYDDIAYDAENGNTSATVKQGYYLIVDTTEWPEEDGERAHDSSSLLIVNTAGQDSTSVKVKLDVPTLIKKVDDKNDSTGKEDSYGWNDSADYDIGDRVPYLITMKMPSDMTYYSYYAMYMEDTVSAGLTVNKDSVLVYLGTTQSTVAEEGSANAETAKFLFTVINNADGTSTLIVYPNADYTTHDGTNVTATEANCGDALKVGVGNSTEVTVYYSCTLNENAVIGIAGNPNSAKLVFSNNPYGDSFGETPEDYCIVFTYKATFNKVDQNGDALAGADFTLYKFVKDESGTEEVHDTKGKWVEVGTTIGIKETTTTEDDSDTTDKNEAAYTFSFKGLDDGYYLLRETTVPEGYNGMEDVHFHIEATHVTVYDGSGAALTELKYNLDDDTNTAVALSVDTGTGTISGTVENRSGQVLPSTGGIGTTIFYTLGALLMIGAAVLLITKRRMNANQ